MAHLVGLFKIRNILSKAGGVWCRALVGMLDPIKAGRFHLVSGNM